MLRDLGYSSEYLFEFHDEEELNVRSTVARSEVAEGTLRTILNGELAYLTLRLAKEDRTLQIVINDNDFVASWSADDGRLKAADLPEQEIYRRLGLMQALLTTARTRLGLHQFTRLEDALIRVRADQFDRLTLIPEKGSIQQYIIEHPASPNTTETVTAQMGNRTWTVAYTTETLSIIRELEGARESKVYPLGRIGARDQMFAAAVRLLRRTRDLFGTSAITRPLP